MLGANANQIAKYCNQHQHEAPNYEALERNISELRERLDEIWNMIQKKNKMIVSAILFVMCLMILFYFIFFDPQFPVILCFHF